MTKLILAVVFSFAFTTASAQDISAANISSYLGNGKWTWTIYLTGRNEVLDKVAYVQYTLHPTFPKPVQIVDHTIDPRYPFGYTADGWGTFTVGIMLVFKDKQVRAFTHTLQFVSASQTTCPSSIAVRSEHLAFLQDKSFADPPVMIYVDRVSDDWPRKQPTVTVYYGPVRGSRLQMGIAYAQAAHEDLDIPAKEFTSAMKRFDRGSMWSITVQQEGDVMQFSYRGRYYLLTIKKVNIDKAEIKRYLEFQICEKALAGGK